MLSTSWAEITASTGRLAKSAILLADLAVEAAFGAADQRVRLDPDPAQLVDRVLGRLRLQLAGVADVGDQGQVDEHARFGPRSV